MKKLLLFIFIVSALSCAEDEIILSEGEINAQKLHEIIDGRDIGSFWVSWSFGDIRNNQEYVNPDYAIEGTFFRIGRDHFNLAKLKKITDWESRIDLDFE